jgi:hypothetical protein
MDKTDLQLVDEYLSSCLDKMFDRFFRSPAYIEDEEDETPIESQGDVV